MEALTKSIYRREANLVIHPLAKHLKISKMYHWMDVSKRTEIVYRKALMDKKMTIKNQIEK